MTSNHKIFVELARATQFINAPIYWQDGSGKIVGINQDAINLLGASKRIIGKTLPEIFPENTTQAIVQHDKQITSSKQQLTQETTLTHITTGETKYLSIAKTPIFDDDNNVIGIVSTLTDLTAEKKRSKESAFKSLKKIAEILPVNIYWLDTNNNLLGCNQSTLKAVGAKSINEIINKTPYAYYSYEIADKIVKNHNRVLKTGKTFSDEEMITDVSTGETKYFTTIKAPLYDDNNKVLVGTVGASIDITAKELKGKLRDRENILTSLKKIAEALPINVYWLDTNNTVLGGNKEALKAIGGSCFEEIIGKTPYDYYPLEIADAIVKNHNKVLKTGKTLSDEEVITDISTGELKYFTAIKAPLHNYDGNILGTIGASIETTAQKEAEKLKLENVTHKQALAIQEEFIAIANQVAHDIRSPATALSMLAASCTNLPEKDRSILCIATKRIEDIANYLLNEYRQPKDQSPPTNRDKPQPLLASVHLLQLVTEKKYHYQNLPISFVSEISQAGYFGFIHIKPSAFDRMLSNLLNNAAQALEEQGGKITLQLKINNGQLNLIIKDNGKGIAPDVLEKIHRNLSVTAGKKDGHGIGLIQVRDTLAKYSGHFDINSALGQGTQISLTFPSATSPDWMAPSEIIVNPQDQLIILDNDTTVNNAWNNRLTELVRTTTLSVKHFSEGDQALRYISNLSENEKEQAWLFSNYELVNQADHGLQVIEKSQLSRTLLVTNHYDNPEIQRQAVNIGTLILPKQLASEINVVLANASTEKSTVPVAIKKVDGVIVDDDEYLIQAIINSAFENKQADYYCDPKSLLDKLNQYPKNTLFLLDNHFNNSSLGGITLAKKLHQKGYKKIYLLSGDHLETDELPDYLTPILKGMDAITEIKLLLKKE